MFETYPDILKLEDICEILNISPNTAYLLLRSHEISGFKCGKNWLVTKSALMEYVTRRTNAH